MQEPEIVRTQNRFRDFENIFRKQKFFENFTSRQFFQFERIVMETVANDEIIVSKLKRVIDRIDSTPVRKKRSKEKKNRKKNRVESKNEKRRKNAANSIQD